MRYLKYLKGYTAHCILAPLAKWIEAALELMVPLVLARVINLLKDTNISNKIPIIFYNGLFLIGIGIVGFLCALFCQRSASIVSQGFGTRIRDSLYAHINTLSLREMNQVGTASMVFRAATDAEQLQTALAMIIRLVVRAPFIVVASIIIICIKSWQIGLVVLGFTILIGVVICIIFKKCFKLAIENQLKMDKMTQISNEILGGARVVRAFNAKQTEHARFFKVAAARQKDAVRIGKISAWLNPLTYALANLAILVVLFLGGDFIIKGNLNIGNAQAIIQYIVQILNAMIVIAGMITLFANAYSAMVRINEVFDLKSSIQDGSLQEIPNNTTAILFDKVYFSYAKEEKEEKYALENISFTVPRGNKIAFVGGTGSGKSTVTLLLTRLYERNHGTLKIFGENIEDYNIQFLRNHIGVVTQESPLFTGTVRSNLQWGKQNASDEEMWNVLELACAKDFLKQKEGLETPIVEGGKNLSGGQLQRLAIARALIKNPQILLLDDSSSALDFATDRQLRKNLASLTDTTIITIAQRTTSIANSDCIYVFSDGKIVTHGTHSQLLQNSSLYQEIYNAQDVKEV